jgi:hypothetical protein
MQLILRALGPLWRCCITPESSPTSSFYEETSQFISEVLKNHIAHRHTLFVWSQMRVRCRKSLISPLVASVPLGQYRAVGTAPMKSGSNHRRTLASTGSSPSTSIPWTTRFSCIVSCPLSSRVLADSKQMIISVARTSSTFSTCV